MAGDFKPTYVASTSMTVTNLHSLASSQDGLAGWCSATITNTSDNYADYLPGMTFTTHASNRQAGVITIYVIASLNDTPTWPASASGTVGTEGALSFTDTEERNAACVPWKSIDVDATASAVMPAPQSAVAALFGGRMPSHFCFYITQNCATTTSAGLAAAGSAVYYTPQYDQYT